MGGGLITSAPIEDYRVDRSMKTFDIPPEKIQVLWNIFCRFDKERTGFMNVEDYFSNHLKIRRSKIGNAMFDLLDTKNMEALTFGEYVDITCSFACMEQMDLVKFCFYALDINKSGTVDKNELKHFVYDMWDHQVTSNIHVGLSFLDVRDVGDGRFNFKVVYEMHIRCPQIFYPIFRLQQAIIRYSFGSVWWEWKKRYLIEGQEDRQIKEINRLRKAQQLKDSRVTDDMVQQRMGIAWYVFPWLRQTVRDRLVKISLITAELDAIDEELGETPDDHNAITVSPHNKPSSNPSSLKFPPAAILPIA